jgi:hypothetical protein
MAVRTVLGGMFIAILFIGVVYAAVSPILQPIVFPNVQLAWVSGGGGLTETYNLIKGSNASDAIAFVMLNVTVKFGSVSMTFTNDPNVIIKAEFQHKVNTTVLDANAVTGDPESLQINLFGDSGMLNLTLGNSCQYGGNANMRFGGAALDINQYGNLSQLDVNIKYAGGIVLNVTSGASFEKLGLTVEIGGVVANIDTQELAKSGRIETDITMGGVFLAVQVDTTKVGASLEADVDTGGITVNHSDFQGQGSTTHYSGRTTGYAEATNKLDIQATIGAGGLTLQRQSLTSGFPWFG